jgi:hypothetical protein
VIVRAAALSALHGTAPPGSAADRRHPGRHGVRLARRLRARAEQPLQDATASFGLTTGWYDPVRLIDATPVPCGASRETVKRSELAGWAHYGYCASHSRWYWGLKLYLISTPDGMPVAWCLADPKIGEREVAGELLAHAARTGALRPGLILIGDKGFAGREFEDLVTTGYGLRLIRPDRRDEAPRHGSIGWMEAVPLNGVLSGEGDLGIQPTATSFVGANISRVSHNFGGSSDYSFEFC